MHHWLSSRLFYPLLAVSVLAMTLYLAWRWYAGSWDGPRFHLNLALAWAPYICALWLVALLQREPNATWAAWIPGLLWLLFFPNAPYLLTDWLYLPQWEEELWYSIVLLMAFSLCGILLSVVSLHLVHSAVRARQGPVVGWATVAVAIFLSGFGVYLGRFLRLNSWHVITKPAHVLDSILEHLRAPESHITPLAFTALFAGLLFVSYYAFLSIRLSHHSREEQAAWPARR